MTPVLQIEQDSFGAPWDRVQFMEILDLKNVVCKVMATHWTVFVGFVVYQTQGDDVEILNLAVDKLWRRRGHGTGFVDDLKELLERGRRRRLIVRTSETNLPSQLFFRSCGFRAVEVQRRFFADGQDAYLMEHCKKKFVPKNRLSMFRNAGVAREIESDDLGEEGLG